MSEERTPSPPRQLPNLFHPSTLPDNDSSRMTASYSEISFSSDQTADITPVNQDPPDFIGQSLEATPVNVKMRPLSLSTSNDTLQQSIGVSGPSRPLSLSCQSTSSSDGKPLDLDGSVVHVGDMTHFVADDLEYKIKLSSPVTKKSCDTSFNSSVSRSRSDTPLNSSLYRQLLAPQMGQIDVNVLNDLEHEARRIAQSVDNLIENLSGVLHSISSITADNVEVYKDSVSKTCDAMDSNIKSMYTILAKGEEVSQAMGPVQAHAARIGEIRRLLNLFENNL